MQNVLERSEANISIYVYINSKVKNTYLFSLQPITGPEGTDLAQLL